MSEPPAIDVRDLSKTYEVPVREGGLAAALKSLVHRHTRQVEAVKEINFEVAPGEIVGFLGPNGAGKTTTLKMLSGLLYPSGGQCRVLGIEPFKRQRDYLRQITLVMGNRNQLIWDIPVLDSFERNRAIYRIERTAYQRTVDELTELLDLAPFLDKSVRNLSLGERMKCEVAAALLHKPQILFLDEPTIGLDVTMQRRIRSFLAEYNQRYGATVLLTSHYMADVEALCKRVVVIHHGQLLFDGGRDLGVTVAGGGHSYAGKQVDMLAAVGAADRRATGIGDHERHRRGRGLGQMPIEIGHQFRSVHAARPFWDKSNLAKCPCPSCRQSSGGA